MLYLNVEAPGSSVKEIIKEMKTVAECLTNLTNVFVALQTTINDIEVVVCPNDDPQDIYDDYLNEQQ